MSKFIKNIMKNPFFLGSMVMVIGSNLHNVGQLVFHFMAGKMLDEANYGDLATTISILGFISIIQAAYGLAIVKNISSEHDEEKARSLAFWFSRWGVYMACVVASLTLVFSPLMINFLHIMDPWSFYLLAPSLFFYILATTYRSILQALLRFHAYVSSLLVEVWIKIPFAFLFMYLGFKVLGAMTALMIGIFFAYLLARKSISTKINYKNNKPKILPIVNYSLPALVQSAAMTSMYTIDLVLVKHYFLPEVAGIYASLAILGRIILFGSSPIVNVMFPIIVKKHSHGLPYHKIFYLSVMLIFSFSGLVVLFYYFYPKLPISLLYKNAYLEGAPLLWMFGLFTAILSLCQLFIQFYFSVGKVRIVWIFAVAAVFQGILIWYFHGSLQEVIKQSMIASSLLLVALIVYFPYHDRKKD